MTRILTLGLAFSLLAVASAKVKAPAKFDATKLVGVWTLTAGVKDGEKLEKAAGDVTITKDKIALTNDGQTFEFSYKVDATTTPASIDLEILAPDAFKGAKAKGIAAIDGKTFKLAYHPMGSERPKTFDGKKGSGEYTFTLTASEKKK